MFNNRILRKTLFLLCLTAILSAWAFVNTFRVFSRSGEFVDVDLDPNQSVSFSADSIFVTADSIQFLANLDQVEGWEYIYRPYTDSGYPGSSSPSGSQAEKDDDIESDNPGISTGLQSLNKYSKAVKISRNHITISGMQGQRIAIFNLKGETVVMQHISTPTTSIDISGLCHGLYTILVDGSSYKIIK